MRKALGRLDRLQSGWANEDRTRLEQAEATAHARASAKERASKNYQRDADPLAMAVAHNTADVSGGGGKVAARRWQGGGRLVLATRSLLLAACLSPVAVHTRAANRTTVSPHCVRQSVGAARGVRVRARHRSNVAVVRRQSLESTAVVLLALGC
jgi:hypothetical protein